ncbi:MAG: PhzF family phenazine biosynthesis protein, partial [Chloroflexota bacterium]
MPSYHLVDVFTTTQFGGNPLAVFPPQENTLDDATMQRIANELNLSETVFVVPPTDAANTYRLRIFTPQVELPMAGHPTVGAAYVLAQAGFLDVPGEIVFEEGVGPIPVALTSDEDGVRAEMQQPEPTFGETFTDRAAIAELLSLDEADLLDGYPVQMLSAGVPFVYVPLASRDAVDRASLRMDIWPRYRESIPHLFLFATETVSPDAAAYSRMFGPAMGIAEDPATGAASGPLGAYLVHYGLAQPGALISEQGYAMGRPSQVYIRIEGTP